MFTRKTLSMCVGFIVVCVMVLTGCASSSPSGNGSGNTLKAGPGVDMTKKIITLGIISPYSGPVAAPIGDPLALGVKVFFDHVNANGGINGFQVKFLEEDSQYNAQVAVQKYNQIHNQILMIADSLGTPPTEAINPLATANHVLVSPATLPPSLARQKHIAAAVPPYRLQVTMAIASVANPLNI